MQRWYYQKKLISGFLIILLPITWELQAQPEPKQTLRTVLESLELTYHVTFTYLDENIQDVWVQLPGQKDLEGMLRSIREQTGLEFKKLDDINIAIRKPSGTVVICGYLLDKESGEAVAGAMISSGNQFAISNESGFFEMAHPGSDTIHVQHLGYQPRYLEITYLAMDCGPILITPQLVALEEVVIRNYITGGISKNIDGSLKVQLNVLDILPGLSDPDVLHSIQAFPGVQSVNETVSNINVRGGTNDQNLVLWEGIKMYKSGNFFGLISAFNPYLTESVTLTKNGTTAALTDGVSSTIDIRKSDEVTSNFSGGAGFNMISGDAFAEIPISKNISIQISGRRSIADLFETPTFEKYFERSFRDTEILSPQSPDSTRIVSDENFHFYDYSFKLLFDPTPKDRLRINLLEVFDDIEYQEQSVTASRAASKTSGLEQKNRALGLNYQRTWNEKMLTRVMVYLSDYSLKAVNFDLLNDQRLLQENDVLDTGFKIEHVLTPRSRFQWTHGYQFTEIGVSNLEDITNPTFRRYIKRVLRSHAGYSEMVHHMDSKSVLRAGVRANYLSKFQKLYLEPRVSFNRRVLDHITWEFSGELKSQTASQVIDFQTDFLGVEKRRWVLMNNDDIPLVQSQQLSSGMLYEKDRLLINLEGYVKRVEGITTSSQGFQNQFEFVRSSGTYRVRGFDLLINKRWAKLNSWASYSLARNDYEFQELTPPNFPNSLDIRHAMTVGWSYHSPTFDLALGGNWHSGKPYTEPVTMPPIVDGQINYELPNQALQKDYLRVDFSASFTFKVGRHLNAQVGGSLWNVLNQKNIINTFYITDGSDQPVRIQRSALGITPNFMLRLVY